MVSTARTKNKFQKNPSKPYEWQRKHSHARRRYRFSWKKIVLFLLTIIKHCISVIACIAIFVVPYFLHIHLKNDNPIKFQQINIYGNVDNIPEATLAELIKVASNKNAFTFDLQAYRQKWMAEPWVNYVKLERKWPNQLSIYTDVRKPFARWGFSKMVDTDGNIFTPDSIPDGKWLFLHGDEKYADLLISKIDTTKAVLAKLNLKMVSLNLDERRAFSIILDNNMQLLLGIDDYESRLKTFVASYDNYLAAHASDIKSVDLRYPSGFAVKWRSKESAISDYSFTASR